MDVSDEPDPPLHDNRISGASPASGTVRMRSLSTEVVPVFHVKHLPFQLSLRRGQHSVGSPFAQPSIGRDGTRCC